MWNTHVRASVVALAMLCTPFAFAEEAAKVRINGGSAALGIGGNWGNGVLTFDGYEYPFTLRGLTIGDLGATAFTGSGVVHDLHRAEDFSGNYTSLGAGLTIAGGGGAVTMRNQNGVAIDMLLTTRGLKIALGAGGLHMEIPPSGFDSVRAIKAAEASAARAEAAAQRVEDSAARVETSAQRAENIAKQMEGPAGRASRSQRVAGRM